LWLRKLENYNQIILLPHATACMTSKTSDSSDAFTPFLSLLHTHTPAIVAPNPDPLPSCPNHIQLPFSLPIFLIKSSINWFQPSTVHLRRHTRYYALLLTQLWFNL
jgi:hypothetical protein